MPQRWDHTVAFSRLLVGVWNWLASLKRFKGTNSPVLHGKEESARALGVASSVVKHLPSTHKGLGSSPGTANNNETNTASLGQDVVEY